MISFSLGRHSRNVFLLLLALALGSLLIVLGATSAVPARNHPRALLQPDLSIATRPDAFNNTILLSRSGHGGGSQFAPQIIRPASDEVYEAARRKGRDLMCWMRNPTLAGAQATSSWTRFEQLAEWGWSGQQGGGPIAINYGKESDRGIVQLVGDQKMTGFQGNVEHKTNPNHAPVTEGGTTYYYPATLAEYQNTFYPDEGVIVASFNFGPDYFIKSGRLPGWKADVMRKPELSQLSDVWWLLWAQICADVSANPMNLKTIVRKAVINDQTQTVLARVLQIHWAEPDIVQGRAPMYPGKLITPDMAGFDALVGTANVWGVAYMLVQRHAILGRKEIKSIRAYNGAPRASIYEVNLIIEIGDVAPPARAVAGPA